MFVIATVFRLKLSVLNGRGARELLVSNGVLRPMVTTLFKLVPDYTSSMVLASLCLGNTVSFNSIVTKLAAKTKANALVLLGMYRDGQRTLLVLTVLFIVKDLTKVVVD